MNNISNYHYDFHASTLTVIPAGIAGIQSQGCETTTWHIAKSNGYVAQAYHPWHWISASLPE